MEKAWSWYTLFLYLLLAIIIDLLFRQSIISKNNDNKIKIGKWNFKTKYIYYMLIYIIFILFSCFRVIGDGIGGADTYNYIEYFNTLGYVDFSLKETILFSGYEYLFFNTMYLVRMLGGNFFHFSLLIYSIIIISYIKVVDSAVDSKNDSWWLILAFLPLLKSLNIVRICVAASLGFVGLQYLNEGKEKRFLLFFLLAFLNHYITIILLVFYLFYKLIPERFFSSRKKIIISNIVMIILSFAFLPLAKFFLKISGFVGYLNKIEISLLGYIPIFFFYFVMLFDMNFKKYVEEKKHYLYYKMMIFVSFILPIFILLNGASRILLFFELPRYILYADIYSFYRKKLPKKYLKISDIIVVILILAWLAFRIYRIWDGYALMPYWNILFD